MIKYFLTILFLIFPYTSNSRAQDLSTVDRNDIAFARMAGIVKYFYPSKNVKCVNWGNFTRYALYHIEKANNNKDLRDSLNNLFCTFAPNLIVVQVDENHTSNINLSKERVKYFWQHKGYGYDRDKYSIVAKSLLPWESTLTSLKQVNNSTNAPVIDSIYRFKLNDSLVLLMPLCMTSSKKTKKTEIFSYSDDLSNNDRLTQLTILIELWNVVQHFYIYLDDTKINWDLFLEQMTFQINKGISNDKFLRLLRSSLVDFDDRHIAFFRKQKNNISVSFNKYSVLPIALDWVEDKVVISKVYDNTIPLKRGDVITEINGKSISFLLTKNKSLLNKEKSLKRKKLFAQSLLIRWVGDTIKLKVKHNDSLYIYPMLIKKKEILKKAIVELEKGYYYINFSLVSKLELKNKIEELEKAKGIIADSRQRTSVAMEYFISLLINKPVNSGSWFEPIFKFPNRKNIEYRKVSPWKIKPNKRWKIKSNVVFLSGNNCFSRGETNLEIVKHYKLGTIIGESTAGTNGDVAYAYIDNIYSFVFTQLCVLNRDKSPFFKKGVQPDIVVKSTINRIKNDDDFLINYALDYIKN